MGNNNFAVYMHVFVSDIAIFVLKRNVKLQLTCMFYCLQCCHTVGWASGRASGL